MARPSPDRFDESERHASSWIETVLAEERHKDEKKETPDPEDLPPGAAICTECGRLYALYRHHDGYCKRCLI